MRLSRGKYTPPAKALGLLLSTAFLLFALLTDASDPAQPGTLSARVSELLRARLEVPALDQLDGGAVRPPGEMLRFYAARAFRPAWSDDRGLLPAARELVAVLADAASDGLRPESYEVTALQSALARITARQGVSGEASAEGLANLDLMLTNGFLRYASHMLRGRVHPETPYGQAPGIPQGGGPEQVLAAAVDSGHVREALASLRPSQPGYRRLRAALARYRALAGRGGYPVVPAGPKLEPGDHDARVPVLRRRLILSGDLTAGPVADTDLFDAQLDQAVRRFQGRHGLLADGIVGSGTTRALNVPAAERMRQIEENMERWRWLPPNLGDRYILVNIPSFGLELFDSGKRVMTMKVIVGKPYLSTPVFNARMTYMVLNPRWLVPRSIAIKEILPALRRDPGYLDRENLRVFEGSGPGRREVDPETIDWHEVSPRHFPYQFRQDPGPKNPLGRLKFIFPNPFDVYLHDTPSRGLFARAVRGFSHGCIRIEKAIDLADYLLKDNENWNRERLLAATDFSRERTVTLPHPISVEIVYFTAWVDEDGTVNFRDDIYGRDKELAETLAQDGF